MIGTPGPFRIIESDSAGSVDAPIPPPRRRYMCHNYTTCLDIAGALNWDNFTCRGCSGEADQTLLWRAKNSIKKEKGLSRLFKLPIIKSFTVEEPLDDGGDELGDQEMPANQTKNAS